MTLFKLLFVILCSLFMLQLMSMFEDILEDTKMLKENNNELAKKLATEQASVNLPDCSVQYICRYKNLYLSQIDYFLTGALS